MLKELITQGIIKFLLGVILVGLLVFVPAGDFLFINGWLFMSILFIPMFLVGIMMIRNPELLKKRLNAKEKQREQRIMVSITGLMFFAGFIVAEQWKMAQN